MEELLPKPSIVKIYLVFTKFRLSFLVIVSALSGYLFVGGKNGMEILFLMLGGTLVTAASNGANQLWECEIDKKMMRTSKRPLPMGWMSKKEAFIICCVALIVGEILLMNINIKSALLGLGAFLIYVFIYTPMKQKTAWAVFIGAIPGAVPPFLGAIAHTDEFSFVPGLLFFIQFTWQFPHFWAIAWVLHEDYQKAGFFLLPSSTGKTKNSAFQIAVYSLALIPFSLSPWYYNLTGNTTLFVASALGAAFFFLAYRLFHSCNDSDARKLMFASFVYLPIIQFTYVFDKLL